MNRQQALEWLVAHVRKWPCKNKAFDFTRRPYWWMWMDISGEYFLAYFDTDEVITQQDWLDFKSNTSEVTP